MISKIAFKNMFVPDGFGSGFCGLKYVQIEIAK